MKMKLTVGLGSVCDYIAYANAGADEVFIGYVPEAWTTTYGIQSPLNRREVLYYNVQIGAKSELEILYQMYLHYQVPVRITLNALSYLPEQYPLIVDIVKECVEIGFTSFIIADMGLLLYLDEFHKNLRDSLHISISGELSEMNSYLARRLKALGANRIIFHRYMTFSQMKACREALSDGDSPSDKNALSEEDSLLEFEAFALNEKCRFHGAFCNSLHCDELTHMCHVPYQKKESASINLTENEARLTEDILGSYEEADLHLAGLGGCGLCALWDLREAGITHLKVVGRGNHTDCMLADIQAMRKALDILDTSASRENYVATLKHSLFPYGCSGDCYYLLRSDNFCSKRSF